MEGRGLTEGAGLRRWRALVLCGAARGSARAHFAPRFPQRCPIAAVPGGDRTRSRRAEKVKTNHWGCKPVAVFRGRTLVLAAGGVRKVNGNPQGQRGHGPLCVCVFGGGVHGPGHSPRPSRLSDRFDFVSRKDRAGAAVGQRRAAGGGRDAGKSRPPPAGAPGEPFPSGPLSERSGGVGRAQHRAPRCPFWSPSSRVAVPEPPRRTEQMPSQKHARK